MNKEKRIEELLEKIKEKGIEEASYKIKKEEVVELQRELKVKEDGILGYRTLFEMQLERIKKEGSKERIKKVKADYMRMWGTSGYNTFRLRRDASEGYMKVYEEVREKGGFIPSSGALRDLAANTSNGRSKMSLHYLGLALDLFIWSGLQNPESDPFVCESYKENGRLRFHIYASSIKEHFPMKEVEGSYIDNEGNFLSKKVKRKLFSFTDIMGKNGFKGISSRKAFLKNPKKNYTSAEWWHFQYCKPLVKGFSQFGIELLKINSIQNFKKSNLWEVRHAIYKEGFFGF